jgi:xanthine dehydrogenase molybdopterin-binding subunit B
VAWVNRDDVRVATILDLSVDRESGAIKVGRVVVAHDCGLVINPDGLKNQVEGNVVQSLSRTLHEEVTFDTAHVTSLDWVGYPILQFAEIPDSIEVVLVNNTPEYPHTAPASPRPARPPQPSAMRCSTPRGCACAGRRSGPIGSRPLSAERVPSPRPSPRDAGGGR